MASSFPYLSSLRLLLMINSLTIIFDLLQLTMAKSCPRSKPCSQIGSFGSVRFPFRIDNHDDHDHDHYRCVYPGFNLSCNTKNNVDSNHETLISLPTGDFMVNTILYRSQTLVVDDPSNCLPRRFVEAKFSLAGTPFAVENLGNFTFLNCSSSESYLGRRFEAIPCMSGEGYTVMAAPSDLNESVPSLCRVLATVAVPVRLSDTWWLDHSWEYYLRSSIRLTWDEPRCGACEMSGRDCRFIADLGSEIGCYGRGNNGLAKRTQIAVYIILFIAITAFLVSNYRRRRRWPRNATRVLSRNRNNQTSAQGQTTVTTTTTTNNNNNNPNNSPGLDATVIESYPKTVVGESRRLLNSNYKVCPICLSEYRTNDTLRTLPNCFHYFHSDCIDEWLRLNATCPLCRNSPLVSPYLPS